MHLEIPKARLHTLKEFGGHYLMIVVSILTALGLEQWIEHAHHQHAAEAASREIEAELSANLVQIQDAGTHNGASLQPLKDLEELVAGDFRTGQPAATINEHIQAHRKQFTISINWPVFASQAWDVAVANQSATWIDSGRLRSYSSAYAGERDASVWLTQDSTFMLSAPRMMDLQTRIDLGQPVDPVEFLSVLKQMIVTSEQVQSHLEQLTPRLTEALHQTKA